MTTTKRKLLPNTLVGRRCEKLLEFMIAHQHNPLRTNPNSEWWEASEVWQLLHPSEGYPIYKTFMWSDALGRDLRMLEDEVLLIGIHRGPGVPIKYKLPEPQPNEVVA